MSISIAPRGFRLIQQMRSFVANARGVGKDLLELAKLEAKLAAQSLASIAIFSIAALILVATGWILLIAALVAWIAEEGGLGLPVALLIVGVVMLAAVIPCVVILRRRADGLKFSATRRQLENLRHGE